MSRHALIPAAIQHSSNSFTESTPINYDSQPSQASSSRMAVDDRRVSYGATSSGSEPHSPGMKGKEPAVLEDGEDEYEEIEDGLEPVIDGLITQVTWRYMSRLYLLVPVVTLLFLASMILLVTFAWPPNKQERKAGQRYPHPFLFKPFLIGLFASCTVQTLRVPVWEVISWLQLGPMFTNYSATIIHTTLHELIRMSTLPLVSPSPTSGFHSSYYLGLGWGVAEVTWGIVQGYEQLALYSDVMRPEEIDLEGTGSVKFEVQESEEGRLLESPEIAEIQLQLEDEEELERRVEVLERMRGRRDLEEVIGVPYPTIPFPLHLLWRLDTLLLNLGLTLILSAFYFDSAPIYRHTFHNPLATHPGDAPSKYLWLVWAIVAVVHVGVSLVWKVVGRVGVGAVTWGGLIVALGSVFAGLGAWGGLV
ncbi:hypothetical protein BCR39DRAFT_592790 [Naematelia encephala]|uniref:Uncharacterized protein n=1 Tax=Naematelia encephala TaxID=71784 RepID=A0A1Y2BFV6_9TREE|nr:hypothetical protein BCR39DRAFT_592790 [Naematelia encephala]